MLRRVESYIRKHQLLLQNESVIVGLSGGADSVALLDILLRLGYKCFAVHCNFQLRGKESERDEQFVREMCQQRNVDLIVELFATQQYAVAHHISVEMAARDLRYTLFERLRKQYKCNSIAVAHHQNDQAETVLLNLIRGTGIRGLEGMKPRNGYVVRPLLSCTHSDILDYLTMRRLQHVEDSSNTDTGILRNLIRQQLKELPATTVPHISSTAYHLQGYHTLVENYVNDIKKEIISSCGDEIRIDIAKLLTLSAPEIVLYELLRPYSFPQTDEIYTSLTSISGRQFRSETHIALKDRKHLIIYPADECESVIPQFTTIIRPKKDKEIYPKQQELRIIADSSIMNSSITFRHYREGDRFTPIGMKGSKKLQDMFTDLHLSIREKKQVWLMLSGDDIAWVVGYRISDKYKVTEQTKEIAEINICNILE